MALDALGLASLVLVPAALGALLLWRVGLRPRDDRPAFAAWSLTAGALLLALSELAWLLAGLPIGSVTLAPLAALALLLLTCAVRRPGRGAVAAKGAEAGEALSSTVRGPAAGTERGSRTGTLGGRISRAVFAAAVGLALLLAADRVLLASGEIVTTGDEAAIWSAKAKGLFVAGGFNARFAEIMALPVGIAHQDYPLLNPLLQLDAFARAGRLLDWENRLPVQLLGLALLLATAAALRRVARPWLAGLLVLLLATSRGMNGALRTAESDMLVALGLVVALDALARWRAGGPRGLLAVAAAALAFLAFSKNEGLVLALVVLACAAARGGWRERWAAASPEARRFGAAWLLLPAAVALSGLWINLRFGLRNDLLGEDPGGAGPLARLAGEAGGRLGDVLAAFAGSLTDIEGTTRGVFVALVLLLLAPGRAAGGMPTRVKGSASSSASSGARLRGRLGTSVLFAAMAIEALVFLGTPHDVEWHLRTALSRLLFQLLPLMLVLVADGLELSAGSTRPAR